MDRKSLYKFIAYTTTGEIIPTIEWMQANRRRVGIAQQNQQKLMDLIQEDIQDKEKDKNVKQIQETQHVQCKSQEQQWNQNYSTMYYLNKVWSHLGKNNPIKQRVKQYMKQFDPNQSQEQIFEEDSQEQQQVFDTEGLEVQPNKSQIEELSQANHHVNCIKYKNNKKFASSFVGSSLAHQNGWMYLYGGEIDGVITNDVYIWDQENWEILEVNGEVPQYRRGQAIFGYKQSIYLYGGEGRIQDKKVFYDDVIELDLEETKWKKIELKNIPLSRSFFASGKMGKLFIVYGGKGINQTLLKDIQVLDLERMKWTEIETEINIDKNNNALEPGFQSSSTITPIFEDSIMNVEINLNSLQNSQMKNSGFYVFGGINQAKKCNNKLWILQNKKGSWVWKQIKAAGKRPPPRCQHTALFINEKLWIYGGLLMTNNSIKSLGDLYFLDLRKLCWSEVQITNVIPKSRFCFSSTQLEDFIIIIGGVSFENEKINVCNADLYIIQTNTLTGQEDVEVEELKEGDQNTKDQSQIQFQSVEIGQEDLEAKPKKKKLKLKEKFKKKKQQIKNKANESL